MDHPAIEWQDGTPWVPNPHPASSGRRRDHHESRGVQHSAAKAKTQSLSGVVFEQRDGASKPAGFPAVSTTSAEPQVLHVVQLLAGRADVAHFVSRGAFR